MSKGRLEAFSDGVIAIIITIMVLELTPPHEHTLSALLSILPTFLGYVLSFAYVGIYWNNHHHLLQAAKRVHGGILWANLLLLFFLSLIPFATSWMGESHFARGPVMLYGILLLLAGVAYYILEKMLVTYHGRDSLLAAAVGEDIKGKISLVLYVAGIIVSQFQPLLSCVIYVVVAIMWLIPDRRIEKLLASE